MSKKSGAIRFLLRLDNSIITSHIGIVTPTSLVQLNVLNHSWVSVSFELCIDDAHRGDISVTKYFEAYNEKKNDYIVQLEVCDDYDYTELLDIKSDYDETNGSCELSSRDNGIIYVGPAAFFNIVKRNPRCYATYRNQEINVNLTLLEEFGSFDKLNYASFVDVALVSCPSREGELENVDEILKNFFREPKVLCTNEVFDIPIEKTALKTPTCACFLVKSCYRSDEKVSGCHTNSLFVSSESKLVMSTPVREYIPQCPCTLNNNRRLLELFWNLDYREAFQEYKTQIYKAINILHHKVMASKDMTVLLEGSQGVGKGLMVRSICEEYCIHFHEENCYDLISESLSATEKRLENLFETLVNVGPCVLYLKKIELLCKDKDGAHEERRVIHCLRSIIAKSPNDFPLVVIGSTASLKDMTPRLRSEFIYHILLDSPDESKRLSLIKAVGAGFRIEDEIISDLVRKTSGFVFADFVGLFTKMYNINKENEKADNLFTVSEETVDAAFEEIRTLKSGRNVIQIPEVNWEDVGGLQHVKKDILDTIELPLKFPNLFSSSLRRSGLLFYGPPGCGKTLLAKAIATEFSLNFYSVKGPELINMYVGQSEENVRNVFDKARKMAPCIIFFDELDSIAPNRGRNGDSGGVMDRIVSQLLTELDGMHNNADVFIIGATNRPDLLDPALLRPGRFDKVIYVGVPEDREERLRILTAVTRKLKFSDDVDLDVLIDRCPRDMTGADFSALASECLMNCYRRLILQHEQNGNELNSDDVFVTVDDLELAFRKLTPSVSPSELERYKSIREQFVTKQS